MGLSSAVPRNVSAFVSIHVVDEGETSLTDVATYNYC